MPPTRTQAYRLVAGFLLLAHGVLAWASRIRGITPDQDDTIYLLLARSIAHGSYRDLYLVHTPPHTLYPPGYPLVLAAWRFLGSSIDWSILLSVAASVATIGLVYDACRRHLDATLSLVILAALAVNSHQMEWAGRINSDALFAALSVGSLWAFARGTRVSYWASAALAIAAALTRSVGIVLLPAIGIGMLWQRRRRTFAVFALVAVGSVGVWQVRSLRAPQQFVGTSYWADVQAAAAERGSFVESLATRAAGNGAYYARSILYQLPMPSVPGTRLDTPIMAALTVAGIGIGTLVLARWWLPAALYLTFYGGLLVIWPGQVSRFLFPLLALLVPTLLLGVYATADRTRPGLGGPAALTLGGLLVTNGVLHTVSFLAPSAVCERSWQQDCLSPQGASYYDAMAFVRDSLPADAVVLSVKPAPLYYYTHRRGIRRPLHALPPSDSLLTFFREEGVTHILLGRMHASEGPRLAQPLLTMCNSIGLRRSFPPYTYVFEVAPDSANRNACGALETYEAARRERGSASSQ